MTPVRIRWTFRSTVDNELRFEEAAYEYWLQACQHIGQVLLYDNLELTAVVTADMEGFRSYAAHLAPYGVRWEPSVEIAMAA